MRQLGLFLFLCSTITLFAQEKSVQFQNFSTLKEALLASKQANKPLFINCYAKEYRNCSKLDSLTFPDQQVTAFYNSNFVNCKFDMESEAGKIVHAKYKVNTLPTLLFLNAQGEMIHRSYQGNTPEQLIEIGKTALNAKANHKYYSDEIAKGERNFSTIKNFLTACDDKTSRDTILLAYFDRCSPEESLSSETWELFELYVENYDHEISKYIVRHIDAFRTAHGEARVNKKFLPLFVDHLYSTQNLQLAYKELSALDSANLKKAQFIKDGRDNLKNFMRNPDDKRSWRACFLKNKQAMELEDTDADEVNKFCWMVYNNYKKFDDEEALSIACELSATIVKRTPKSDQAHDTYAHMLFALGKVKKAIKYEKEALRLATEQKCAHTNFYTKEISRFEKKLVEKIK